MWNSTDNNSHKPKIDLIGLTQPWNHFFDIPQANSLQQRSRGGIKEEAC